MLVGQRGRLADQLDRVPERRIRAATAAEAGRRSLREPTAAPPLPNLEFFNGLGGFAEDGREYVTILGPGQSTPAPWINVIANPAFGFQVAAEGGGYTWSVNSRENQLTPWSNDPVSDRPGEAFYLRDEDTGDLWGPTALPIRDEAATYVARHGRGYSRFEHAAHGIALDLLQYVPLDDPIKISRLTLRNTSSRTRRLSVTAYVEWVLGPSRAASAPFVVDRDRSRDRRDVRAQSLERGLRLARRLRRSGADGRPTGPATGASSSAATARSTSPAALARRGAALQDGRAPASIPAARCARRSSLPPGGTVEIVFFLGEAASADEARALIARYRAADLDAVLARGRAAIGTTCSARFR